MSVRVITSHPKVRRHARVRQKIAGSSQRPRLNVFRSARHIYAQLIDDSKGITLVAASDKEINLKDLPKDQPTKTACAFEVGQLIAQKALAKNVTEVVFDRGGYRYHGRVKSLADGARAGKLVF